MKYEEANLFLSIFLAWLSETYGVNKCLVYYWGVQRAAQGPNAALRPISYGCQTTS